MNSNYKKQMKHTNPNNTIHSPLKIPLNSNKNTTLSDTCPFKVTKDNKGHEVVDLEEDSTTNTTPDHAHNINDYND